MEFAADGRLAAHSTEARAWANVVATNMGVPGGDLSVRNVFGRTVVEFDQAGSTWINSGALVVSAKVTGDTAESLAAHGLPLPVPNPESPCPKRARTSLELPEPAPIPITPGRRPTTKQVTAADLLTTISPFDDGVSTLDRLYISEGDTAEGAGSKSHFNYQKLCHGN
jgi:hypothetical protein